MKIAFDKDRASITNSTRGIGVNTNSLYDAINLKEEKGLTVEFVDRTNADLSKYDIVHYQYFNPNILSFPLIKRTNIVLTIHDLIPLIYPNVYQPGIKGRLNKYVQTLFIRKYIDAVITISETSKKDIIRFLGVDPNKVFVTYLAPKKRKAKLSEKEHIVSKYRLQSDFVLYVGDVNYNKNVITLLKACRKLGVNLVIVGKSALDVERDYENSKRSYKSNSLWSRGFTVHPEIVHYRDLIKEFNGNKRITRLGFIPEEDLVTIYNLASVYVQPSLYEGFGLPVLEAQACGLPTVISKTQALVEITNDSSLYFEPNVVDDLCEKISVIIKDIKLRNDLINRGLNNVKNYSWSKTAKETINVYKKVYNSSYIK